MRIRQCVSTSQKLFKFYGHTYMSEFHVLLVVDGWHGDFALRHEVVVVDVVAEKAVS